MQTCALPVCALVTMSKNPRQISKTRTFLGSRATEIAAARLVAQHLKCTVASLRRPSATKWNTKVSGKTATRHGQENNAAAQTARLSKEAMHDLRAGRRMLLCRTRTLLSVWSSLLPADLEDFVLRYPVMVKMFSQEPALVVISAMWKFGPARDALATAWCTVRRSAKHGSISTVGGLTSAGPANRVRALRLYSVLVEAVKLLSHVDMSMWAINAGKNVSHHQGWLAWCQLRVPIVCPNKSGTLFLGQQRCTRHLSVKACPMNIELMVTHLYQ
jgi:hypothetical protein